jgi:hypothetical protein
MKGAVVPLSGVVLVFPTCFVSSRTVPYVVRLGGEYFLFGGLSAVDDFVSFGTLAAIGSPSMLTSIGILMSLEQQQGSSIHF